MTRILPIVFLLLLAAGPAVAQQFTITGRVTNSKMEPLAFVSVQVRELQTGTLTKADGTYELKLDEGRWNFVFSMIGYQTQNITLTLNRNYQQNLVLEDEIRQLSEVVVKGKGKDRAEEIIRQVIERKDEIRAAAGAYSCKVYIKAVQQDSAARTGKQKRTDSLKVKNPAAGFAGMAMTEILLQLDYESPRRMKEERLGVKQSGTPDALFYLSTTDGNFDFYNNLVKVPALSATPFLSPISYSGLVAYKFRTVAVRKVGRFREYTISMKPKQVSNAVVEGEVVISDSNWTLLHTRFIFPKYHLPEYDYFEVEQDLEPVQQKAVLPVRQKFTYRSKAGKRTLSGTTTVHYSDFTMNKTFDRNYFGPEVGATAAEAYEKDSLFWQTVRTEPLSEKELRFIRYKDSVYRATHTAAYLDSIDRLTNKVTWKKMLFSGQNFYNRALERTWSLPTLTSLYQPVAFGGGRINLSAYYSRIPKSRKSVNVYTNLSYGIRNHDINGNIRLFRMYNPFNRGFYSVAAGRDFQFIYEGDAWINMIQRANYYLSNHFSVGHGLELVNGLYLYTDLDLALRRSLSDYKTGNYLDTLLPDILTNNQAIAFEPYNALYGKIRLAYTPAQRYLREPREKVILGSRWPTFYVQLRKGLPGLLQSKVDFDYVEFGVEQQVDLGLLGVSRYHLKTGSFLSKRDLRMIDYQFQRRGDPWLFLNPEEAFQALDSSFPVFQQFYQGHFVHQFNGAFINRVPLLKKLNLREVAGAGFLLAPERDLRYAETFAGIERVFKWPFNPLSRFKLGVYVVGSVANQFSNPVQFKVGVTSWDNRRNRWF